MARSQNISSNSRLHSQLTSLEKRYLLTVYVQQKKNLQSCLVQILSLGTDQTIFSILHKHTDLMGQTQKSRKTSMHEIANTLKSLLKNITCQCTLFKHLLNLAEEKPKKHYYQHKKQAQRQLHSTLHHTSTLSHIDLLVMASLNGKSSSQISNSLL